MKTLLSRGRIRIEDSEFDYMLYQRDAAASGNRFSLEIEVSPDDRIILDGESKEKLLHQSEELLTAGLACRETLSE